MKEVSVTVMALSMLASTTTGVGVARPLEVSENPELQIPGLLPNESRATLFVSETSSVPTQVRVAAVAVQGVTAAPQSVRWSEGGRSTTSAEEVASVRDAYDEQLPTRWSAFLSGLSRTIGIFPTPARDDRSDLEIALSEIAEATRTVRATHG